MPAIPLVSATVERAINQLLALDPDSQTRLQALNGKRLTVVIPEMKTAWILAFSDEVHVLSSTESFAVLSDGLGDSECLISAPLTVLPQLRETARLTALIKAGTLSLAGNLSIAQQVSGLFQSLDIDWEEQLASRSNDVFANQVFALGNKLKHTLDGALDQAQRRLADGVIEEKQLAAHKLQVLHFCDQVSDLRDDAERLQARLEQLEKSQVDQ